MSDDDILTMCAERLPSATNMKDHCNIRMAARFAWERKEMGGAEHVQFAYRNRTPIVPVGHCCHPIELVKRGFIDGIGWPSHREGRIKLFKWPDGCHWYASIDGNDVQDENGNVKWNTQEQAMNAAKRKLAKIEKEEK